MIGQLLGAAVLGGICYLDRTAAFQVMLSRPLVVATLVGTVFGDFAAGAKVGIVLELLYIVRLPVGASVPPDDTGAAVFAGAAAATSAGAGSFHLGVLTLLLLLSVPCAELGKVADRFVRRVNGRIAHMTVDAVERGEIEAVDHGLLAGVTLFGVAGALLSLAFAATGAAVATYLLPRLDAFGRTPFTALFPVLPLLGAASIFSSSRTDRSTALQYLAMAFTFAALFAIRWVQR